MILKKDLNALKKHIITIAKKVDNLLTAHEKDVKAKPTKKVPAIKRAKKLTATNQVLKIINRSRKGVDIDTLKNKTGLEDKKLRNIIFRAYKEGKIKREGRGVYISLKAKAPVVSKAKAVKAKPAKKAPATKRATKVTATDKVLKIINRSKKGVDTATLKEKTGFDDRKVRNIIFKTLKEGKIKREGRGVYISLKAQALKASKEKAVRAKPAVKAPLKEGAKKLTATDKVLKMVNPSKEGVDIIPIKKKTGFEDKKVRNIIFRAYKEGKIQREGRGLYIGVK